MVERRVHPTHQARSRRTERAIAEALGALLREKPFPDITVAEIAQRAGVSVGGFYARYPSKDALLGMLELAIIDTFAATARDALALEGASVGEIARAYAGMLISNFRTYRAEIVQILRYAQNHGDSLERVKRFNEGVHDRMRALLKDRASERAINLALFFAGAAAREAVLMNNLRAYPIEVTDAQLAEEIARAFEAYLGVP